MSEKLNASYAKNASKLGKYFLIKSLTPRQVEEKNRDMYRSLPHICIAKNMHNLELLNIVDGRNVCRHISQVKEIFPEAKARLSIPDDLLAGLHLVNFNSSDFKNNENDKLLCVSFHFPLGE